MREEGDQKGGRDIMMMKGRRDGLCQLMTYQQARAVL